METGKEARRGLGPAWVAWALGAIVALAFVVSSVTKSGGPLELAFIDEVAREPGRVSLGLEVRNRTADTVEVVDVRVPGVTSGGYGAGARTIRVQALGSERILLRVPTRCPDPPPIDRLDLTLRIDGREVQQRLFLGALPPACP